MMIDFALEAERNEGLSSREAIYQACLMRFRPIMMTTFAAILGALPLALGLRHRVAPIAGHLDRRRPDREPGADALHDAGRLSLSGPLPPVVQEALAALVSRHGRRPRSAYGPGRRVTAMDIQRLLIVLGAILLAAGLLWPWLGHLGLGRLPGDIAVERPHFRLYFPWVTCLVDQRRSDASLLAVPEVSTAETST